VILLISPSQVVRTWWLSWCLNHLLLSIPTLLLCYRSSSLHTLIVQLIF
jgi:hypothetical protein